MSVLGHILQWWKRITFLTLFHYLHFGCVIQWSSFFFFSRRIVYEKREGEVDPSLSYKLCVKEICGSSYIGYYRLYVNFIISIFGIIEYILSLKGGVRWRKKIPACWTDLKFPSCKMIRGRLSGHSTKREETVFIHHHLPNR